MTSLPLFRRRRRHPRQTVRYGAERGRTVTHRRRSGRHRTRPLRFGTVAAFGLLTIACDAAPEVEVSEPTSADVHADERANEADIGPERIPSDERIDERSDRTGNFRTNCLESHQADDDPLVHPGEPGRSHHHVFFGNPETDAFSTIDRLLEATSTTCDGGTLNRSAYWVPAMFDQHGDRIEYVEPLFYYKSGFHVPADEIVPPPAGLSMIAGDAMATEPQHVETVKYRCASWTTDEPQFDPGDPMDHVPFIPDCDVDDLVEMRIVFPQCWDGDRLTAPDHRSHMAYPVPATAPDVGTGHCPESHPIAIPEISYNFHFHVTEESGPSDTWRLSSDIDADTPGGVTTHADWMNGWDEDVMSTIVTTCINRSLDCGVGNLGDGTRLRPIELE